MAEVDGKPARGHGFDEVFHLLWKAPGDPCPLPHLFARKLRETGRLHGGRFLRLGKGLALRDDVKVKVKPSQQALDFCDGPEYEKEFARQLQAVASTIVHHSHEHLADLDAPARLIDLL